MPDDFDQVQYRSAAAAIDALDEEERRIVMRAVPYDTEAVIGDGILESFAPGSFAKAVRDASRVKLWSGHSTAGGSPVGYAEQVEDRDDGVWVTAHVSRTAAGEELLTLARDGVLDQASIEFQPDRKTMQVIRRGDARLVRHKRATLRGVALVAHGAYGRNAQVLSVRDDVADARDRVVAHLRSLTS